MKWLRFGMKAFFSYPFIIMMLFILGAGAATATFLETMYDTQTAKILVYDAWWYELVMALLSVSMIGLIVQCKMWTRKGAFIVHSAFVVILIGAALTRYLGYEGVIHIREGHSEHEMVSVKSYLQIITKDGIKEYPLALTQLGSNDFSLDETLEGKTLHVMFKNYRPAPKGEMGRVTLFLNYGGETQNVTLQGGAGWVEEPVEVAFKETKVALVWGSKVIALPFSLKLVDFQLERYPGSMSPSSYASEIEVIDPRVTEALPYRIFMNHPLTYQGFKFFQSSYDTDEKGTVLEVNKDPGKWPTYAGYFLLCVGFLLNFFTKGSRFTRLRSFLQKNSLSLVLPLCLIATTLLKAEEEDAYLASFRANSYDHAQHAFSELLVQDYMGRIKPISTEALEIVNKMTSKSTLYGLSAEQIVLGMVTNPAYWQQLPIVKSGNAEINRALGLDAKTLYVSFSQAFDNEGYYRLAQAINDANQKAQSKRTTFDNDVIKFDEKLNIAYLTFKGIFFKFIPVPDDPSQKWLEPNEAFSNPYLASSTKRVLNQYLIGLQEGIQSNVWYNAEKALKELKVIQEKDAGTILPTQARVKAEVLYNHLAVFKNLIWGYFILGAAALITAFIFIFVGRKNVTVEKTLLGFFIGCFTLHTFALALRWYISGHAPWSDSYESLVYIGWSAALAGIVVFRKSMLALASSSLLASIAMLVAHLSFINPQITNLVPVLKSYWLSVHVSVITGSYGFLGLGALLGMIALGLMLFKTKKNQARLNEQIRYISAINEISLIIGLAMLTVGNFFGGIWANESWGRYWGWDPKETWSFVSIIVYAIILHVRFIPKLNSIYVFNVASLIGFSSILMTYFGVNFYLTGMHSYAASGEHPTLPTFVYYTAAVVIALCIAAYRGHEIKSI